MGKESVMESRVHRLRIGPFRLIQRLDAGPWTERWLALNEREESTHVAHRVRSGSDRVELRRLVEGMERLSTLSHPHVQPIEHFTLERSGTGKGDGAWIVTPYTGTPEGLLTLSVLRDHKGGQMAPVEVERTLTHLLEAAEHAHAQGFRHGPVSPEEILVDRRGSVSIELYGLGRILRGEQSVTFSEVERDEVRSIVEIGYWLLTGLSAEEPRIRADRLIQRLDHRWDEWFDAGLDPMAGYLSAGEALSLLPTLRREVEIRTNPVRTVLGTFRRVLGVS
jgi:serine/threonine protein kinase